MARFRTHLIICLGLLVGCADFPNLSNAITEQGLNRSYPRLVQLDLLGGIDPGDTELIEKVAKLLSTRARQLRRRARSMRGPVIQPRERAKMMAALARHPIANTR